MKKIAIIHHTGEIGGGTKSLVDMALMLCERYEIIICVPRGDFLENKINKKNVSVQELKSVPYLNLFSGAGPLLSKATLKSLTSLLGMENFCDEINMINPDLVLFNSIVTSVTSVKLKNRICALIDRETMVNSLYIKIYNRIIKNNIKGAAFLCEYEKGKFDIGNDVITAVIPDCVPQADIIETLTQDAVLSEGTYKVLFMGGSSALKGIDIVLEAVRKVTNDITFVIAGNFDFSMISNKNIYKHFYNIKYCRYLIRLRKAYKYASKKRNVKFVGIKSDIYPLIKECDVVVFPSSKVHQPRPCIEAGYFKKPVILSDFKETEEYFKNGYNALTFKPNDASALAKCIDYAFEHRAEMVIIGKNNYEMSMRYHDYDKVKGKLNSFVDSLI